MSRELTNMRSDETFDLNPQSKRWKEQRSSMRKSSQMKSVTPLTTPITPNYSVYDNQCVVVDVCPQSPSASPVPVLKRRCSLTMPYPALYGSWQVQVAPTKTPAKLTDATYDSPLTQRKQKPPLQRRWSTLQMDLERQKPLATPSFPTLTITELCETEEPSSGPVDPETKSGVFSIEDAAVLEEGFKSDDLHGSDVFNSNRKTPHSDDDEDRIHLMTSTLQRLPLKDFAAEVRPAVDVAQFLQQSVLLLDVVENSPQDLVDLLLNKILPAVAEEAKSILFTHDSGN